MRGVNLSYFVRRIGMFVLVIFVAASFNFMIPRHGAGQSHRRYYVAHVAGQRRD